MKWKSHDKEGGSPSGAHSYIHVTNTYGTPTVGQALSRLRVLRVWFLDAVSPSSGNLLAVHISRPTPDLLN